jgi:hypothetical protein
VNWILIVNLLAILFSNELCFLSLVVWNINLEFLSYFSGNWVIKSVKELSHNSESLRDDTTNFPRVIASLTTLHGHINNANTSERRCQPELFIVKSTRIHAEHGVWLSNQRLSLLEKGKKGWGS